MLFQGAIFREHFLTNTTGIAYHSFMYCLLVPLELKVGKEGLGADGAGEPGAVPLVVVEQGGELPGFIFA